MLAPQDEARLLGLDDPLRECERDIEAAARLAVERAYDRGRQAGVLEAGEPWVALFFAVAGFLVGLAFGAGHVG